MIYDRFQTWRFVRFETFFVGIQTFFLLLFYTFAASSDED